MEDLIILVLFKLPHRTLFRCKGAYCYFCVFTVLLFLFTEGKLFHLRGKGQYIVGYYVGHLAPPFLFISAPSSEGYLCKRFLCYPR